VGYLMGTYLLRRLAISVPVLLGITLAVYVIISLAPGDPVDALINPEAVAALGPDFREQQREALGLNQPILVRYAIWLKEVAGGNLGQGGGTQRAAERALQPLEDLVDAGVLRPIARLQVVRPGARHLQDGAVQGAHCLDQADLLGRSGESVAAGVAARGGHQPSTAQGPDQLLDVGVRQLVRLGDAGQRCRALTVGVGQRDQHADAVLGAR